MANDIIISAFKGYDYTVIAPYINSLNQTTYSGDKVLIAIDTDKDTHDKIKQAGWQCIAKDAMTNMAFHNERFYHIHNYMKDRTDYRYMISTDVRDVVFQRNPVDYIQTVRKPIIAVSEDIRIQDEHWNRNNILKCFPDEYSRISHQPVLNVGILSGDATTLTRICEQIFQLSLNRNDWVADQAAYNVLMRLHPYYIHTYISNLVDAYACNLHITHKPEELEMFRPYLMNKPPIVDNDLVVEAETGLPYHIVHQYDRDPQLANMLISKYK